MQSLAELPFVAGRPALDFVNTAELRGDPEADDVLRSPADLATWGRRYGLLSDAVVMDATAEAELRRALEARELLYAMFRDRTAGGAPAPDNLTRLAALAADAWSDARLHQADDGRLTAEWDRERLSTVRHVAVTDGVRLLEQPPTPRLKQCPGDHCGWFFLDTTKRGNRRWCLMSECGQDAKDRRRRARRAPGPPPADPA